MRESLGPAIAFLERELEALDEKRGEIEGAIRALRRLAPEDEECIAPPKKASSTGRPDAPPAGAADKSDTDGVILAALKKHGGQMKPGALAAALKITVPTLRYQLKALVKAKQVVVTGVTGGRRVSLAGVRAPKEAP